MDVATYNIHFANQRQAVEIKKLIDRVITEREGVREMGLLTDEAGSIVIGDDKKHKELVKTVTSLAAKASAPMKDFRFSALAVVKGWRWLETITDHSKAAVELRNNREPLGERLLFTWSSKRSVIVKLDQRARTNIHGTWMRWSSDARIKVTKEEGEVFGVKAICEYTNKEKPCMIHDRMP